jgi:radical SAM protein with 4Fe4S-binding SPASM domain
VNDTMLDLELTRRCNLRCDYCFVGWSRDWTSDMPRETALRIVEEGEGLFSTLHLTGGEPFAHNAIFEVLEAALARGYERVVINTNGTLLTPERVRRLAACAPRVSVTVSLDGPEEIHDAVRGPGRFRQALDGLRALHAAGVDAQVMTVVTKEVLAVLPAFVLDLHEAAPGLRGITLFPVGVGPAGSQKPGAELRPLSAGELRRLCAAVALLERAGISIGIGAYPIVNPLLSALGYPAEKLYRCTAGRGRVCVHADLTVSTCHPVKEPVYGAYRPGLLRALGASPEHHRIAARDYDGCRSCEHQEACGHCRAFVTASGRDFYGNDEVCHDVLERGAPRPSPGAQRARDGRLHLPVVS